MRKANAIFNTMERDNDETRLGSSRLSACSWFCFGCYFSA